MRFLICFLDKFFFDTKAGRFDFFLNYFLVFCLGFFASIMYVNHTIDEVRNELIKYKQSTLMTTPHFDSICENDPC